MAAGLRLHSVCSLPACINFPGNRENETVSTQQLPAIERSVASAMEKMAQSTTAMDVPAGSTGGERSAPRLTPAQRLHFDVYGYVVLDNVLTPDEVAAMKDALYRLKA